MNNFIEKFDSAKTSVQAITDHLVNLVITDRDSRDMAFDGCKQANKLRGEVDNKRKEFLRPIASEKKLLKSEYEKSIKPLDELKKKIENYAKTELLEPLESAILTRKNSILAFDDKMRREEADMLAKIEADKRQIELDQIEALKKAEEKTGIAKVIAFKQADNHAEHAKTDLEQSRADLLAPKSGRQKTVLEYELQDIALVPEYYLKPREINWLRVKLATNEISGFKRIEKTELMFQ